MSHRHIGVHLIYDPPARPDPWTGAVERDDSCAPHAHALARCAEEALGPAALGERAGSDGRAIAHDELLKRASFCAAPALLDWLARERPALLARLAAADAGGGEALATAWVRAILPLAGARDKRTLVRWGLSDFRARFGRPAAGFWLPEGAVDSETLEILAEEGVAFVLLEPSQAEAVRPSGGGAWTPADPETLDPKTPYLWRSSRAPQRPLAVFFVHRRLSRALADGTALASAETFATAAANRLLPGDAAQLVHAAADGEELARARPGAERPLALALDLLAGEGTTASTPSRFLALFPPPLEAKIRPDSSWTGADWGADWRTPLREAAAKLAARLDALYEDAAGLLLADPWLARDEAAELWRAGSDEERDRFLDARAKRTLRAEDRARALRLLTMQRERLLALDARLWSSPDPAAPGARAALARLLRACELARLVGEEVEEALVERLAVCRPAGSRTDAATVWRAQVKPRSFSTDRAAAHFSLLDHLGLAGAELPDLRVELGPAFRGDKSGLADRRREVSSRPVRVERPLTRETTRGVAVVHRADRLDLACWLLPEGAASDSAEIARLFGALDDDAFRAEMDARAGRPHWSLDALWPEDRAEVVKALSSESAHGGLRAAFLARWTRCASALRRGGTEDDAALALLEECAEHGLLPAELPWAWTLEARLQERLEAVIAAPADARLASALFRWLDALSAAGLVVQRWRLREGRERWRAALEAAGERGSALDACRALGERLGHAETFQETT